MDEECTETTYSITPECPCCIEELKEAELIDMFHERDHAIHHIITCSCCERQLELVIYYANPTDVEIWVTTVDAEPA